MLRALRVCGLIGYYQGLHIMCEDNQKLNYCTILCTMTVVHFFHETLENNNIKNTN